MIKLKRKQKTSTKTTSEMSVINKKYLGDEYIFSPLVVLTDSEIGLAYNWYNYMKEDCDSREYLEEFIISSELEVPFESLSDIKHIPPTDGWTARLFNNGYTLPSGYKERLISRILNYVSTVKVDIEDKPKKSYFNPSSEWIANIEDLLDKNEKFSVYSILTENSLSRAIAKDIYDYYFPIKEEWEEVLTSKDPQIKEAYATYNKSEKKAKLDLYSSIISDVDRFLDNNKIQRKPRAKKAVPVDKIIKGLKYQKDSPEFKLNSVHPSKLIGAKIVYLFNTKNKFITVIESDDGLSVKGTTIVADDISSTQKSLGRKSEIILRDMITGTKAFCKRTFNEIKSNPSVATSRVNENTIILKVF